jgi:hypothetical protein
VSRDHWILNAAGEAVPFDGHFLKWAEWFETADRVVMQTDVAEDIRVSTVFLGLDYGFGGRPLVFETMVFRRGSGCECDRYSTRAEALAGHAAMVERARAGEWKP